jgi:hypothetical protein
MSDKNSKMQTCECKVQSDSRTTVLRRGITPAEAVVIMSVLGEQALIEPVQKGSVERTSAEEMDRLQQRYDGPNKPVVSDLFPGHNPELPMTFSDAGIDVEFAPSKKRQKGNIKAVKGGNAGDVSEEERKKISEEKSTVTATD